MGVHVTGLSGTEIINGVRRLILTLTTLSDITIKPGRQLSVHNANTLEDARNILSTPSCREKYLSKN